MTDNDLKIYKAIEKYAEITGNSEDLYVVINPINLRDFLEESNLLYDSECNIDAVISYGGYIAIDYKDMEFSVEEFDELKKEILTLRGY